MIEPVQDVVVVGGGLVGTTAACALGQQGLRVTVVEGREPAGFEAGAEYDLRVSAVSPGSESILRALGVWERIESARACPYRQMHVWDAGGTGEIHFDCVEINETRLGHIVENRVIQRALIERTRELDAIAWRCPQELRRLELSHDAAIVELNSGEQIPTRLLVGADGPLSRVRELAGIAFKARDYHQRALVATVATELPHLHTAWQRFLPDGVLAFLPLGDGRCSIVWSTSEERASELAAISDAAFRAALAEAFDYRLGRVLTCGARAVFPLRGGQAEPYVRSRAALIGDAAHSIHPLAGMGANLGFTDAAILADVLRASKRDLGSLRTLRRYERARKGDNLLTMLTMEGFKALFGAQTLPLRWLRNLGLNLADAATPAKHAIMRRAMGLSGERPRLSREYA